MSGGDLWSRAELLSATNGELRGAISQPMNGVVIDSRAIAPGDIFVAIKGDRLDGHDYVEAALKAGAGVAIVSRSNVQMEAAGPVLVVADPLEAMCDLARAARARSAAKIIAVTGSVGKTTTKEALRLALSACGETHASVASFNNHWGVPLTLARMPRSAQYAIFEIGMNHAGEIIPLVAMVRPDIAIITTIAESHLGHFASLDEIADAKAEIFAGVQAGGAVLLPRDSVYYERLNDAAIARGIVRRESFGAHEKARIRLVSSKLHATCTCAQVDVFGEEICFKLGQPGLHVVMNTLAVLGAVEIAGADLARATLALADLQAASGRGVQFAVDLGAKRGKIQVIDESYNANPASMRAALAMLGDVIPKARGRRIAVLGDMLELGEHSERLHRELAAAIDESSIDVLYACGPEMQHLWNAVAVDYRGQYEKTSQKLCEEFLASLRQGDVVMIKGSLGSQMGLLVTAIRDSFQVVA